jgi:nucleotide-binding universal stress UspA family protein
MEVKMVRRILSPTDLTRDSRDSVEYALRLAKDNGAQLIVFHATSFPSWTQIPCEVEPFYRWEECVSKFKIDQLLADAERNVRNFVGKSFGAEANGLVWKTRVALGKIADEIVMAAVQEEVDLIVMARCKRGPLARTFALNVQEAVSSRAPCPVLSIDTTQFVRASYGWRLPLLGEIFQRS